MKITILSVVGARPNFMKIAPFIKAIDRHNNKQCAETSAFQHITVDHILVHTGQHYDSYMSESFFRSLDIPQPEINLGIGSGSHAEQVGRTMIEFEKILQEYKPNWVVVVGDVNATLACSVTAKKEHIQCCHIEAGLRSGDMKMPEEINRLVTDRISDLLLAPDRISVENLLKEGTDKEKIEFVGNIMIDTLEANRSRAEKIDLDSIVKNNLIPSKASPQLDDSFAVMTLHRPSNVDLEETLCSIVDFIVENVLPEIQLLWSIHPRTKKQLQLFKLWDKLKVANNLILLNPIDYLDMLRMNMGAKLLLTDSGGLQEECTVLGTPCITLRLNTERPVTLREYGGVSVLVGNDIDKLKKEFEQLLNSKRTPRRPELWDGNTAARCINAILSSSSHL